MPDERTPTLRDIAYFLQVACGGEHHPKAVDTARWLIEQSPAPRQLRAELTAKPGEEPSMMELARLLCAITSNEPMPEALDAAHWLVAQSEPVAAHLERLKQLADDAGEPYRGRRWMPLLELEQDLEHLLEAEDDWQHPSDVLDPTHDWGVNCRALYTLCLARIDRVTGASRRSLEAVRDKLERPAKMEGLLPASRHRLERLGEWLAELEDPESAADSLEEMARLLRSTLESPERFGN